MLSDIRRRATRIVVALSVAGVCLLWDFRANAQSDLPAPQEPWLANPGDWAADFNAAQVACYQGSMGACDSIWTNDRILMDSFLYKYGRTCGGRVDLHEIVQASVSCTEAFPGHD